MGKALMYQEGTKDRVSKYAMNLCTKLYYSVIRRPFGKEQRAVVYAFLPPRNYPETFNVQKKQKPLTNLKF